VRADVIINILPPLEFPLTLFDIKQDINDFIKLFPMGLIRSFHMPVEFRRVRRW
jgi:hypothetical protein